MKASKGRIVHVIVDPQSNNGDDTAPAIITRVWSDQCVNVRVLRDGFPSDSEWMTSVPLYESREALEQDTPRPFGAFWPPRAEHQPGDRPPRY